MHFRPHQVFIQLFSRLYHSPKNANKYCKIHYKTLVNRRTDCYNETETP